ncbi:MAG: pyridoxamine 5'-phosphate oxidase family protein [bacterium]
MEINDLSGLEALYGETSELARHKVRPVLDVHCRNFIALSPFLLISSASADGRADVSPKGDPPGFVKVLDDKTLLIPDRPGNNRLDGMRNILENPHVGLIFMIPGVNETLRINGRARIITGDSQLQSQAVKGKIPKTGLLVEVEEAFLHCSKALVRSRLWDQAAQIERSRLPSMGRMLADQIKGVEAEQVDRDIAKHPRENLY